MLKIRLSRVGRKNRPLFRVVVTQKNRPVKSGYLKSLGTWDPVNKKLDINQDEVKKWLKQGAKLSDTVNNILIKNKIVEGEIRKTSKDKPVSNKKTEESSASNGSKSSEKKKDSIDEKEKEEESEKSTEKKEK